MVARLSSVEYPLEEAGCAWGPRLDRLTGPRGAPWPRNRERSASSSGASFPASDLSRSKVSISDRFSSLRLAKKTWYDITVGLVSARNEMSS